MRAALYCRVSSSQQRKDATIETQIAVNEDYCRRESLEIVARFLDDGLSGTIEFARRPGGYALLEAAAAREFDCVVVYDISRLGRDDHATIAPLTIAHLRSLGLQVLSPNTRIEDTPEGRLLTGIEANIAAFYRADMLRKTMDGKRRAAREGRYVGGQTPYGYRLGHDRKLAIDEVEAAIVRRIFAEIAAGGSANRMFQRLNAEGIPRPEGGPWYLARVIWIVRQTTYRGEFRYTNRGEAIIQQVPPIVDTDTWRAANERLTANKCHGRPPKHDPLCRGLLVCGLCGRKYYHDRHSGERACDGYYHCAGIRPKRLDPFHAEKEGPCKNRWLQVVATDEAVWREVRRMLARPERVLARLAKRLERDRRGVESLRHQAGKLRESIASLAGQVDAVLGFHRRGRITEDAAERQLAQIQAEENALREALTAMEQRIASTEHSEERLRETEELLAELRAEIQDADSGTRRRVTAALITHITVHLDGTLVYHWRVGG